MKKVLVLAAAVLVVCAGYFVFTTMDSKTPIAHAAGEVYEGTIYVSSMGGFFVKANVKIDPTKAEPIQLTDDLTRQFLMENQNIAISKKYYPTHDPRIDHKRKVMFWSAYFVDDRNPAKKGVHYGKIDLKTGKVLFDGMLPHESRNKAPIQYCASGQTKDKYLIVMMGFETFVDIVDKDTMKHEKRVFLDTIPEFSEKKYLWTHGINSPDMKEMAIVTTLSDEGGKFPRGEETKQRIFILDMNSLLDGKAKVLRDATITSDPKKSAFFRLNYTDDQKYLLLSNRDRSNVLDAKTLKEVAVDMHPAGWENHDFFPTPDGNYAIQSFRVPVEFAAGEGTKVIDGQLQLYDLKAKKKVGKPTSVCKPCHMSTMAMPWAEKAVPAVTCGIDGMWKK